MNNLIEILIRWTTHKHAFHTDIQKYNAVRLEKMHRCYQLYLWSENLDLNEIPRAYDIIANDTYMDDCFSGTEGVQHTMRVTDEVQVVVGKGGFSLKGFTISGNDPPEHLSSDQESVLVAGLKWFPKGDFFKININKLNFNKGVR